MDGQSQVECGLRFWCTTVRDAVTYNDIDEFTPQKTGINVNTPACSFFDLSQILKWSHPVSPYRRVIKPRTTLEVLHKQSKPIWARKWKS